MPCAAPTSCLSCDAFLSASFSQDGDFLGPFFLAAALDAALDAAAFDVAAFDAFFLP